MEPPEVIDSGPIGPTGTIVIGPPGDDPELEARQNLARQLGQAEPYSGCGWQFYCDPLYHLACQKTPGQGGPRTGRSTPC